MNIHEIKKIIGKSKLTFSPLYATTGKVGNIGNGAHVLIKKEMAQKVGIGKKVGVIFFELEGE
jgi:energy-converting hydrogenase Eha subunit H